MRTFDDHFVEITEMVEIGSGAQRPLKTVMMSRYACYLVIQNADPAKEIVAICNLGILAGLPDGQIEQEIKDASGNPPLTAAEIRHALRRARRDVQPLSDRPADCRAWRPPPPKPPPLGPGAASFVRCMIGQGEGADFGTLAASSPVPTPTDPNEQTAVFLETLYAPGEHLFCGDSTDRGKIGVNIRTAGEWIATAREGGTLSAFLIGNPLTGRQGETLDGKPSYRCASCVASFRYALVEVDALPLPEQCAFWQGVIGAGVLPLRALTYSGGKSIHGLIEIGATDRTAWGGAIETLLYATANKDAPKEHQANRACKNPDRLTRTPGAFRADKGRVQSLLWLAD